MKKLMLLFWVTVFSVPSTAQTIPGKIDTLLTAYEKQESFCGTVLVSEGNRIIFEKGYGHKNRMAKTADDIHTLFQIGSITKQFTSAIILQLQEENKLSVQERLSEYIPDYPRGNQISIENLLTHTSGIYNYTNDREFMLKEMTKPISRERLIDLFKNKPLDFEPGQKYSYSNSGYILLGYIIEKITGKSYFQVVREKIFQPLHMDHSGFDFAGLKSADKAIGYGPPPPGQPAPIVDSSVSFSAGAIYTTVGDLYKWDRALYTDRIVSQASLQKAFTPHLSKYGYGWVIDSVYGKRVVEHGGGIPGFTSFILRVPENKTCIIVFDNQPLQDSPEKIANDINAILNGKKYDIPEERKAIFLDTAILKQYVGEYQLAPGFVITISLENGNLVSQATGQIKTELFAERKDFFFLKIVDAQMEFIRGADHRVEKLVLHQNGRLIPGNKIR